MGNDVFFGLSFSCAVWIRNRLGGFSYCVAHEMMNWASSLSFWFSRNVAVISFEEWSHIAGTLKYRSLRIFDLICAHPI